MNTNDREVFVEAMFAQPVALNSGVQIIGPKAMFDRAMNANWLNGGNSTPAPPPATESAGAIKLTPGSTSGTYLPGEDHSQSLQVGVATVVAAIRPRSWSPASNAATSMPHGSCLMRRR